MSQANKPLATVVRVTADITEKAAVLTLHFNDGSTGQRKWTRFRDKSGAGWQTQQGDFDLEESPALVDELYYAIAGMESHLTEVAGNLPLTPNA